MASALTNKNVLLSERCCGEAGTFAVSRPDIATQLRYRKQQELSQGIEQLTGRSRAADGNVKMLTSCPSCQQGLARYASAEARQIMGEIDAVKLRSCATLFRAAGGGPAFQALLDGFYRRRPCPLTEAALAGEA